MNTNINMDWVRAALVRAIKTMAQTALGMFTIGAAISDIQWGQVVSVAIVAGIYSLLTSFATGLPEAATDGTLLIDNNSPTKSVYRLDVNSELEKLSTKKIVVLKVDPSADLSQK